MCVDPNGLYPHPSDCQKYYQCGHGTAYEYTCPSGTLFNQQLNVCDWEANVVCNSGGQTSTSSPSSSNNPTTTSTTLQPTVSGRYKVLQKENLKQFCFAVTLTCADPNGIYAYPGDCSKYYQCGHGTPYVYTCPSGTLFNDQIKTCDWAANVVCNTGVESTTLSATASSSEATTTAVSTNPTATGVSTNPTTSSELIGSSCSGTICGRTTNEPITEEIRNQRETASCTLDNDSVEAIQPLASSNPQNVKNVEAIFPESKFNEFFPNRNSAYTYTNFLRAIGKYPSICSDAGLCPKILTNMFGHIKQETADLYYIEEINKGDYCKYKL